MIVGLTGQKQHGKDTAGRILVEEHGFVRVSFADALKQSAAALFDVPVETWDEFKNDDMAYVELFAGHHTRLTVRQFLQRYGTEAHRDVFGGTFWTDVVEGLFRESHVAGHPEYAMTDHPFSKIVVTDVRFDEEAALVRKYGGKIANVYRPQVVDDGDTHASEELPSYDFVLWNGGTLDDLRNAINFDILGRGLPDKLTGAK